MQLVQTIPELRRPRSTTWIGATVAGGFVLAMIVMPVGLAVLSIALYAFAAKSVADRGRRRRAIETLAALRFPVEHDSENALDPGMGGRPVRSLTVDLRDGTSTEITGWTWGRDDVLRLAHVLSTMDGVVGAHVKWGVGGPIGSL